MLRYKIQNIDKVAVSTLLNGHSTTNFRKMERYYKGDHDIMYRQLKGEDKSKPNNKVVANFAQYISDLITGYFIGEPVTYTSKKEDEKILTMVRDIAEYNDQDAVNTDLALTMSIKSKAYELMYLDSDKNIRSAAIQPDNAIMVYSTDVDPEPVLGLYFYWEQILGSDSGMLHVEAYTQTEKIVFESDIVMEGEGIGSLQEVSRAPHFWGQVPIIEYINPAELGDFERTLTLIDAYNKVNSDSVNNQEYFAEAYLLLQGMSGTHPDDVRNMKENRTIPLAENADAKFLVKPASEADVELLKDRIVNDIHIFSNTPNLRDESFGAAIAGVALKYKMYGLEQYTALKERQFKKGLQRRIEMICYMLNMKGLGSFDYRDINVKFTRNTPQNLKELAEIVNLIGNKAPLEELLALLPFIHDPAAAALLVEEAKAEAAAQEVKVEPDRGDDQ